MTDNTNRLTAILIAAVALIGLGCAVAVANTSNSGTNTADTTADDYSTYTYYGTTSSDVAAKKMSAEEISMLTSDLVNAQVMCESATMALGQIHFEMPTKALKKDVSEIKAFEEKGKATKTEKGEDGEYKVEKSKYKDYSDKGTDEEGGACGDEYVELISEKGFEYSNEKTTDSLVQQISKLPPEE